MFEHHNQPILPYTQWLGRVIKSVWLAVIVVLLALAVGVLGYHIIGNLSWVDSLLEASMILGGMGAIAPMTNDTVKLFASAYALLSGFVILSSAAIIVSPWLHRILHHLHKNEMQNSQKANKLKSLVD